MYIAERISERQWALSEKPSKRRPVRNSDRGREEVREREREREKESER